MGDGHDKIRKETLTGKGQGLNFVEVTEEGILRKVLVEVGPTEVPGHWTRQCVRRYEPS